MGYVAAIALVIGAIGKKKQGDAQAKLLKNNQKIAEYGAQSEIAQGEEDVRVIGQEANRITGSVRAGAAANGLSVNEGSSLDIQEDVGRLAEMDKLRARYNAKLRAWGLREEAKGYGYQAKQKKLEANQELVGGLLGAFGKGYGTSQGG